MTQATRALAHAFETGALAHPPSGQRAFFLRAEDPPFAAIDCEQSFRPAFLKPEGVRRRASKAASWPLGLVLMTKHKEENFANIARGWALLGRRRHAGHAPAPTTTAPRASRGTSPRRSASRAPCRSSTAASSGSPRATRSHRPIGAASPACSRSADSSWLSTPGIFSWDRIDDGSALLAAASARRSRGSRRRFRLRLGLPRPRSPRTLARHPAHRPDRRRASRARRGARQHQRPARDASTGSTSRRSRRQRSTTPSSAIRPSIPAARRRRRSARR